MEVYVYTKLKDVGNSGKKSKKGDIVYIYSKNVQQPGDSFIDFVPFVIDLTIPCGQVNFDKICSGDSTATPCNKCQYYDPEDCDVRKFTMGEWDEGDPPELKNKYKHKIKRSKFITQETEDLIVKKDKNPIEIAALFTTMNNIEMDKADIEENEDE